MGLGFNGPPLMLADHRTNAFCHLAGEEAESSLGARTFFTLPPPAAAFGLPAAFFLACDAISSSKDMPSFFSTCTAPREHSAARMEREHRRRRHGTALHGPARRF